MSRRYVTEACVGDAEGAARAATAGADRVELCANLVQGGTTPSLGALRRARALTPGLGLMVMIRPRGGDFHYSDAELLVMEQDIDVAKAEGADGVVLGLLETDGTVDVERTRRLVERARPMSVTFHRAFDVSLDLRRALEDVASTGADRVLTSGGRNRASDAVRLLTELNEQAGERLKILLGGVKTADVAEVAAAVGVDEVHFAALSRHDSPMRHRNDRVRMGAHDLPGEYERDVTDERRLNAFLDALHPPQSTER